MRLWLGPQMFDTSRPRKSTSPARFGAEAANRPEHSRHSERFGCASEFGFRRDACESASADDVVDLHLATVCEGSEAASSR